MRHDMVMSKNPFCFGRSQCRWCGERTGSLVVAFFMQGRDDCPGDDETADAVDEANEDNEELAEELF